MNHYPIWKNLLLVVIIVTGVFFAMPNLFGDDPAVQVSAGRQANLDLEKVSSIEAMLKEAEIEYKGATLEDSRLLIRFADSDAQLQARELLQEALVDENFIVALNLAPNTPSWLMNMGAKPMNLGWICGVGCTF